MPWRWPFRATEEPADTAEPGSEADALQLDEELPDEESPPGQPHRRRVALLALGLILATAFLTWRLWPASPGIQTNPDPTPLLAARPLAVPARDLPPDVSPQQRNEAPSLASPAPTPVRAEDQPASPPPRFYGQLPPPAESARGSALQHELAQLGWTVAVEARKTTLAELEAKTKELEAKRKEAEARIHEADAWIQAMRKNPSLVTRARGRGLAPGGERPRGLPGPPPFEVPPPPDFGHGPGALVVPPKPPGQNPAPAESRNDAGENEKTPRAPAPRESEILVRMIDASGDTTEAMISLGPVAYVVRAGDSVGPWRVSAINPRGVWVTAGPGQRVWRPLMARGPVRQESPPPAPSVAAGPAAAAPSPDLSLGSQVPPHKHGAER